MSPEEIKEDRKNKLLMIKQRKSFTIKYEKTQI